LTFIPLFGLFIEAENDGVPFLSVWDLFATINMLNAQIKSNIYLEAIKKTD
jgi:hypothetical protein